MPFLHLGLEFILAFISLLQTHRAIFCFVLFIKFTTRLIRKVHWPKDWLDFTFKENL